MEDIQIQHIIMVNSLLNSPLFLKLELTIHQLFRLVVVVLHYRLLMTKLFGIVLHLINQKIMSLQILLQLQLYPVVMD